MLKVSTDPTFSLSLTWGLIFLGLAMAVILELSLPLPWQTWPTMMEKSWQHSGSRDIGHYF